MTRDKDRKRIIRTRMKKTGESYTAARAHIISKSTVKRPAAPAIDHAALAGMSNEKVAAKTGRTWPEWTRVLDEEHAAAKPHREIATLLHEKYRVADWWAQTVTVGYERIKGLRERGQRRDGAFEANKSRTFNVPVKSLFDAWANGATRRRWLNEAGVVVRTATRPKSMRLQLPDGTLVAVGFWPKGASKSSVSVQHMKLRDRTSAEKAKTYWTGNLDALASVLSKS